MAKRRIAVNSAKRVFVCSRHPVTVAGFQALVDAAAGFCACGFPKPAELRTLVAAERPEVLILDDSSGITLNLLREIRALTPTTGVILWTDGGSAEFVRQAIGVGLRGVLGKEASVNECVECLARVAAGEVWLEEKLSRKLLCSRSVRLTPREGQLISLLTEGLKNKEIAWRMQITEGTAKAYLTRLYQKTGANDRFELAVFAMRHLAVEPGGGTNDSEVGGRGTRFAPTSLANLSETARDLAARPNRVWLPKSLMPQSVRPAR